MEISRKEEYKFMGMIKRKTINRERITPEEIENLIDIAWNHGYDACITGIKEAERYHKHEN